LGRAFGRIETRLQLLWVLASLLAVVIPFPLRVGDAVVAIATLLAALSYLVRRSGRSGEVSRRPRPPLSVREP
jgi:hypothetical protein